MSDLSANNASEEVWRKRLEREKNARLQAEELLEAKSLELYHINKDLEEKVLERTQALKIETEKALNLSKSKSEFLAIMSHEIRTPVNGILGILELTQDTNLPTETKELVHMGISLSEILLHVINDILDYSKIEAGKLTLKYHDFNLTHHLRNNILVFQKQIEHQDIELHLELSKDIPELIHSDPYRLAQLINNYMSNAIKFTQQGSITLKVFLSKDKQYLEFSVHDTGIGISEQNKSKIFRDFSQIDDSLARNYEGTGLGLVINKKIAELMGGEVGFNSTENEGSHFWARVAYVPATTTSLEQTHSPSYTIREDARILLVDDNAINTIVAKKLLHKLTPHVDTAASGIEAIEQVKEHEYTLVLMDINMPGMSGLEATEKIREFNTIVPIVALTANTLEKERGLVFESGMNDFITKPLQLDKINTLLDIYTA